ncbi:MAG: hypothetical protein RI897_98 [Verrucomicrobiota bacterium]
MWLSRVGVSVLSPEGRGEQDEHGEELEAAEEHEHTEDDEAASIEEGEVLGGADGAEAGADIEDACHDGGQAAIDIEGVFEQADADCAEPDADAGEGDEEGCLHFEGFIDDGAVEAQGEHLVGAEGAEDFVFDGFEE